MKTHAAILKVTPCLRLECKFGQLIPELSSSIAGFSMSFGPQQSNHLSERNHSAIS